MGIPPQAGAGVRRRRAVRALDARRSSSCVALGITLLLAAPARRPGRPPAGRRRRRRRRGAFRAVPQVGDGGRRRARRSTACPTRTHVSRRAARAGSGAHQAARRRARTSPRRSPTSPTRAKPNDEIFVLLIGHGSFDGKTAAFNLPGPDLTAADYAEAARQVSDAADRVRQHRELERRVRRSRCAGPARTIVAATQDRRRAQRDAVPRVLRRGARRRRPPTAIATAACRCSRRSTTRRQKVEAAYEKGGHILTEHATLDDGSEGKLAATQFLAPPRSRSAEMANADPALRALLEERDALERQVAELRLRKDRMDAAAYEQQLEKLLTELALKTERSGSSRRKNETGARRAGARGRAPRRPFDPLAAQGRRFGGSPVHAEPGLRRPVHVRPAALRAADSACLAGHPVVARLPGRRAALHADPERGHACCGRRSPRRASSGSTTRSCSRYPIAYMAEPGFWTADRRAKRRRSARTCRRAAS